MVEIIAPWRLYNMSIFENLIKNIRVKSVNRRRIADNLSEVDHQKMDTQKMLIFNWFHQPYQFSTSQELAIILGMGLASERRR